MSDDTAPETVDESVEPEPAETTHAFDVDGGACEACGATVERRWRQDGALVCPACKRWTVEG